jgi:ankyrin repeat protein
LIKSLLQHGALIDRQNKDGDTALTLASSSGNAPAVKVLLANHASTALRNGKRSTAADVARDRGFAIIAQTIEGKG